MTKITPFVYGSSQLLAENLISDGDVTHSDNVFNGIFHVRARDCRESKNCRQKKCLDLQLARAIQSLESMSEHNWCGPCMGSASPSLVNLKNSNTEDFTYISFFEGALNRLAFRWACK